MLWITEANSQYNLIIEHLYLRDIRLFIKNRSNYTVNNNIFKANSKPPIIKKKKEKPTKKKILKKLDKSNPKKKKIINSASPTSNIMISCLFKKTKEKKQETARKENI